MGEYTINGKKLTITPSDFRTCVALKNAVIKALNKQKLSIGDDVLDTAMALQGGDISKANVSGDLLGTLLNTILSVAGSTEVEELLMECAKKAVIGVMQEKIDLDYFEREVNREDYIPVMYYLLIENVGPFFKGASSMLPALEKISIGSGQKQK